MKTEYITMRQLMREYMKIAEKVNNSEKTYIVISGNVPIFSISRIGDREWILEERITKLEDKVMSCDICNI